MNVFDQIGFPGTVLFPHLRYDCVEEIVVVGVEILEKVCLVMFGKSFVVRGNPKER